MPTRFELPSLAQKDYAQLFSQLRQSIPRYASRWTDFNESDPGITLLQLLSWLGDVTLYRADTLPRGLDLDFARLILGAGFDAVEDLIETLQRDVVVDRRGSPIYLGDDPLVKDPARLKLALLVQQAQSPDGGAGTISSGALRTACLDYLTRSPYRAVTAEDYSQIAISMTEGVDAQDNPYQKIARAEPVFGEGRVRLLLIAAAKPDYSVRYSSLDKTARIKQTITAKVSTGSLPYPRTQLDKVCAMAAQYFAPRIILGTALEVRRAASVPVDVRGEIALLPSANVTATLKAAYEAIAAALDPLTGGPHGTGWPVGRPVGEGDIAGALAGVEGIDHGQPLRLSVTQCASLTLGTSRLSITAPVNQDPALGVPLLAGVSLAAVLDTWSLSLGEHARVAATTRLSGGSAS